MKRATLCAILLAQACFLVGCASAPPVQPTATSKSQFAGAFYGGKTIVLDKPTPGEESYRAFRQAATGFISLQTVRSVVEEIATAHCDRMSKSMHGLLEHDAKPPFILATFHALSSSSNALRSQAQLPPQWPTTNTKSLRL